MVFARKGWMDEEEDGDEREKEHDKEDDDEVLAMPGDIKKVHVLQTFNTNQLIFSG